MLIHVVSAGETLWQIANRYAAPMSAIIQLNALPDPNQLVIGQSLVIPSSFTTHTVKKAKHCRPLPNNITCHCNPLSK